MDQWLGCKQYTLDKIVPYHCSPVRWIGDPNHLEIWIFGNQIVDLMA